MSTEYKNKNIIGFKRTANGGFISPPVDGKAFDALEAAHEMGGRWVVRPRKQEAINSTKDPTKAQVAFLEFMPKAEVDAYLASLNQAPKDDQAL